MQTQMFVLKRVILIGIAASVFLLGTTMAHALSFGDANFQATLSPGNEVPPVTSSTTGQIQITGSDLSLRLDVTNADHVFAAHLHCAPPGINGPVVVSLFGVASTSGVSGSGILSSGMIEQSDIASTSAECISTIGYAIANLDDLSKALAEGKIYANVHSAAYPAGTSRGQLTGSFSGNGTSTPPMNGGNGSSTPPMQGGGNGTSTDDGNHGHDSNWNDDNGSHDWNSNDDDDSQDSWNSDNSDSNNQSDEESWNSDNGCDGSGSSVSDDSEDDSGNWDD